MEPDRIERERRAGRAFVALADTLVDDFDVVELLNYLVTVTVELLEAHAAGIVLADAGGTLRAVAASSGQARVVELLQLQSAEGPCLDCYHSATTVQVPDVAAAADRWPTFVAEVRRTTEFRSVHALPLRLRGEALGAFNLFRAEPGVLPDDDVALAQAFADVATIGILHQRAVRRSQAVVEQLQSALDSRIVIEQAKGVITQSTGLDVDAGFALLRAYCRRRRLRLTDVAQRIVDQELDVHLLREASG